jgi:benzylsuccinate CoA-transferase BbsE subunit
MAGATGPLAGVRVVELAAEATAYAGKLLADMGAEVVLVEPRAGSPLRQHGPFVDDVPDPERCLWWWHHQTSKYGVTADLDADADRARLLGLFAAADVVLEAELPGALAAVGIDADALLAADPRLIWLSITGYGPDDPRSASPPVDLTILAEGGPAWSCGYDDHSLPPVRGGGGQAFNIGAHYAVMGLLTALLFREHAGRGQRIDVNLYAAANVTTEFASYSWLVAEETVQRQTGRHAMPTITSPTQGPSVDGGWVNTGVPPRTGPEFGSLIGWLEELGLAESFDGIGVLQLGTEVERIDLQLIAEDPLIGEIFQAGRDAQFFIASRIGGHEFFVGAQQHGMAAGVVYAPEDVVTDPHFVARGWPTPVHHPELGRTVTYPGAPIRFERSPWSIARRAPQLGEHDALVFADGDVRFPPV